MIPANERADELCAIMQDIVGIANIKSRTRQAPYPLLRAMIWTQMVNDGYSRTSCGRSFDMDHATVTYNVNKWRDIAYKGLPGWRDYLSIWRAFQKRVVELPEHDNVEARERLTVSFLQTQMRELPPDATIVLEPGQSCRVKYDQQLNTLFIRG